jgi:hypothetical protein
MRTALFALALLAPALAAGVPDEPTYGATAQFEDV